jgi:putative methionine-R-sulfoxide reductase with GAF domain
VSSPALDAIEGIVDGGGDADDVLRGVVAALVEHAGCDWAGILFVEDGELVLGPEAGSPTPAARNTGGVPWDAAS